MPGNDIHGGFATHLLVPAHPLVPLDHLPASVDVRELSVVADAVSTAYQAILRSGLAAGDAAVVIGAGGVGGFTVQIARALGARVVACDVQAHRLALLAAHGAEATVDVRDRAPQDVRKEVHGLLRGWGIPSLRWRLVRVQRARPPGSSWPSGFLPAAPPCSRWATRPGRSRCASPT